MEPRDRWCEWLLRGRFGGDVEVQRRTMEQLRAVRDRVLDGAEAGEGHVLLDVGCGDGLIAFGALERGVGRCIFSDVSQDVLDESRRIASELGVLDRCRFQRAPADDLSAIENESVDVVTTRSVLIYVIAKPAAFREFHRVLRPGGRVSLFEPINRLNRVIRPTPPEQIEELAHRISTVYDELQPAGTDPMLDFDERDLVDLAEQAGFERVTMTLETTVQPAETVAWEAYLDTAPNPNVPAPRAVMERVLSPQERELYEAYMRPEVESGGASRRMAVAYLVATRGLTSV
jgi:ubiquinone/menaquinone biosynthesis C-methylase UbiE